MQDCIVKGGRPLRLGYTTGSCATAAAVASASMLLTGTVPAQVMITLPNGEHAVFPIVDATVSSDRASCCVKKDAGDDPDVTDGIRIAVECQKISGKDVEIFGGPGVGVVTAEGLSIPIGRAAINPGPQKMIRQNIRAMCEAIGYRGGLKFTIAAPGGEAIALKTFNPRLGIQGGISILGTTGIVEPMSAKAVIDTIKLMIDKRARENPDSILITPGNYGQAFCRDHLGLDMNQAVKYGNFLGECLDYAAYKKFRHLLLVGHAGKLIKTVGGIMDTHSSVADCRMEIIAAHAACSGADTGTVRAIMQSATTEGAIEILTHSGYAPSSFARMREKLLFHLEHRAGKDLEVGVIVCNKETVLMQSDNAAKLVGLFMGGM